MIHGKNSIGNKLSARGSDTFQTFDPLRNIANACLFHEATADEIEEAVALATRAFRPYSELTHNARAQFLEAIAAEMLSLGEPLLDMYCSETGLPKGRAMGERGRTISQLGAFATLVRMGNWVDATIDTADPAREPAPKPDIRKMMIPLGPVGVFGASNFPFAFSTAGGDTASALASGCPVIVKSHPMHAGTGEMVATAILQAAIKTGMPEGVFSNLNGKGIKAGELLVAHSGIQAVGFTGSTRGGLALGRIASGRKEPIPVFTEMGSVNPVILLPGALQKNGVHWAKAIAGSITLGAGQFCTNPGLLFAFEGDGLTEFMALLSEELLRLEPSSMLHPDIFETYEKNRQMAKAERQTTILAEYAPELKANNGRPTILSVSGTTFLKNSNLHKEVFGPFSLVVQCADQNELEAILTGIEGQLTGTIIAAEGEIEKYKHTVELLQGRVGRIIYNGVPTGVEVCGAMHHGGPFPATSDSRFTSVGLDAIKRWVRPLCFQDWPEALLPAELKNSNPLKLLRMVDNQLTDREL